MAGGVSNEKLRLTLFGSETLLVASCTGTKSPAVCSCLYFSPSSDAAATRLAMLEPVLLKASSSAVDLDVASPLPPNNFSTISKLFLSEFETEVPSSFVSTRFDPSFLHSWRPAYLISSLDAQLCTKFNLNGFLNKS